MTVLFENTHYIILCGNAIKSRKKAFERRARKNDQPEDAKFRDHFAEIQRNITHHTNYRVMDSRLRYCKPKLEQRGHINLVSKNEK